MIKAVIFDLDDTLISESEYIKSGFKSVSKEISNKYNLDYKYVVKKTNDLFSHSSKNVFNRVLQFFNIDYSHDYILYLIEIYRNHDPKIKFFDDVIDTINYLKDINVKIGIITDGYKESQRKKIQALKCNDIFDKIIITDELGREFWKPNKKSYEIMASELNILFSEMIYIGDNEEKDFKGANELGILTFKVERENRIYTNINVDESFQAKFKVKDIKSIIQYIDNNLIKSRGVNENEENFICNYS